MRLVAEGLLWKVGRIRARLVDVVPDFGEVAQAPTGTARFVCRSGGWSILGSSELPQCILNLNSKTLKIVSEINYS